MAMYLYSLLWPVCSIRDVSFEIVVPYPRCYRFIRTVMEKYPSSSSSNKLDGSIESVAPTSPAQSKTYKDVDNSF